MFDDLDDMDAFISGLSVARSNAEQEQDDFEDVSKLFKSANNGKRPILEPPPVAVPFEYKELTKRLCVCDTETDPFVYGRAPAVFWVGFFDGEVFLDFWGDDAVDQFFAYLLDRREADLNEELVIYAHNGGKFDFNFFMDYLDDDSRPFLINSRIVKIDFLGFEFRDSYALIPVAQGKFSGAKLKIDYGIFEREEREKHKEEIRKYARHDCIELHRILDKFITMFGWRLTVAGTALPMMESFHGFNKMTKDQDKVIRPYYAGGRVQCFETGILRGKFIMVDANSMYPSAMKNHLHPVGALPCKQREITDDTDFAYVEAINRGCLGYGGGLNYDFTIKRGKFFATIHEIRAGIDTGTLEIIRVLAAYSFQHKARLSDFVDHFYRLRIDAGKRKDDLEKELYKLMLNSPYGKTAMNTIGYKDWLVNPPEIPRPIWSDKLVYEPNGVKDDGSPRYTCTHSPDGWRLTHSRDNINIYSKPTRNAGERFINVALAASITGAARSDLWRAICASDRVVYCDTDSMVCENTSVKLNPTDLGAWKVDAEGDCILVAGKKMYAFMSLQPPKEHSEAVRIGDETFYVVKKAHKGVQLTGAQIAEICGGAVIEHLNMAPSYGLDGKVKFTKRRVKMTTAGDVSPVQMELEL